MTRSALIDDMPRYGHCQSKKGGEKNKFVGVVSKATLSKLSETLSRAHMGLPETHKSDLELNYAKFRKDG